MNINMLQLVNKNEAELKIVLVMLDANVFQRKTIVLRLTRGDLCFYLCRVIVAHDI